MERNPSIYHVLRKMSKAIVKTRINLPIATYILVFAGVLLFVFTLKVNYDHRFLYTSINYIASVAFIYSGILCGLTGKLYFKYIKSGTQIFFYNRFIDNDKFYSLSDCLESGCLDELQNFVISGSSTSKLQIALSADSSFCIVQVVKYIPFNFAKRSKVFQLDNRQINLLIEKLKLNDSKLKSKYPY